MCVTKLDVLDGMEELKVCVAYRIDGKLSDLLPAGAEPIRARCRAGIRGLTRMAQNTVGAQRFEDLPATARAYLDRIEAICDVPIDIISTGPDRAETIVRRHPFE